MPTKNKPDFGNILGANIYTEATTTRQAPATTNEHGKGRLLKTVNVLFYEQDRELLDNLNKLIYLRKAPGNIRDSTATGIIKTALAIQIKKLLSKEDK